MNYMQKTERIVMLVCVIMYNLDFSARPLPFKDEVYYPEENEDGFNVYFIPKELARTILVAHEDRFRLFKSKSINVTYEHPGTGANCHKKINPWYYTKQRKQTGIDPNTKENLYKSVYVWFEDPKNFSVRSNKTTQDENPKETIPTPPAPELKPETGEESVTKVDTPPVEEPVPEKEEVKDDVSFDSLKALRDKAKRKIGDDREKATYKLMREKIGAKGPVPKKEDLHLAIEFYNKLIKEFNAT